MIRRPPRSTRKESSAASDVYKRQGKDTYWLGFSLQDKMQLTLKDGATWYNAITPGQKDQKGNPSTAKIGYLTSDKGVINMLGSTTFTASSESLNGHTTADNPSGIVESENGITGNVEINNYKGNGTVIYRHDKADPKKIIGGDFRIKKAEKGSEIRLRTDSDGLNTTSVKAEDGIRDYYASRGLGDVYKRQIIYYDVKR